MKHSVCIRNYVIGIISASFLVLTLLLANSCDTKPPKDSFPAQVERGKVLYKDYCVRCHGEDGTGIIIDSLDVQPSDLTTLQIQNGGLKFPTNDVAVMIDGRQWVEAHGEREMPSWGDVFYNEDDLLEKDFKGQLGELIAYLMSIQKVGDL